MTRYRSFIFVVAVYAAAIFSTAQAGGAYTLMVQPNLTQAQAQKIYAPVASYLSKVSGHTFVLRYTSSWLEYQLWTLHNKGDVYFDGAQFVSWRVGHQHALLGPGAPQMQSLVMFVRKGAKIDLLKDTYGRPLCATPPPSLPGLWVNSYYANPARLPLFIAVLNGKKVVTGVSSGKCAVGVTYLHDVLRADPKRDKFRVLFSSGGFPAFAFTFSTNLPRKTTITLDNALLSPAGQRVTRALRNRFSDGYLVQANPSRYAAMDQGLSGYWASMFPALIHANSN